MGRILRSLDDFFFNAKLQRAAHQPKIGRRTLPDGSRLNCFIKFSVAGQNEPVYDVIGKSVALVFAGLF